MTATLDSVEAELAAAHEAAELHREVVRFMVSEVARLRREADQARACEAAALGLLPALRARLAESEAEVGAIRASAQSMVEAWRDASQDRVKMVREQGFNLGVEHCALELEKAITEEPAWESATWRQRAEAAEKQLADSERKMGEIVSSDWTGSEALRVRLSAATRVVEAAGALVPLLDGALMTHGALSAVGDLHTALREWKEGSKPVSPPAPVHVCRRPDACVCRSDGLEPNEKCPVHGAGEWPPRCAECGRLMKWSPPAPEEAK